MSDNVQGFNHLDAVLLNVGSQMRQDAIRQLMAKAQMKRASAAHTGQDRSFGNLQREAARIAGAKRSFLSQFLNNSKDVTGVQKATPQDAEAAWMKTDDGKQEQMINMAVSKGVQNQNKGLFDAIDVGNTFQMPQNNPLDPYGMP